MKERYLEAFMDMTLRFAQTSEAKKVESRCKWIKKPWGCIK